MPALVIDGQPTTILHVSQIASLLGVPQQGEVQGERIAWDTVAILASWMRNLVQLDWQTVLEPTLSRGRSIRNLTVNTFHPFELLPQAFEHGEFLWYPERDAEREIGLGSLAQLCTYADKVRSSWELFVAQENLTDPSRRVSGPRGDLTYVALLDSQRWHAAWHHRQLGDHCRRKGVEVASDLGEAMTEEVGLPNNIY